MLSLSALLCAAMILKDVSTLPTDTSSTTSTDTIDNSTTILATRDVPNPVIALGFYDGCPLESSNAHYKGGNLLDYKPKTCQEVDEAGEVMLINWKDANIQNLTVYYDKKCQKPVWNLNASTSMYHDTPSYPAATCQSFKVLRGSKIQSVQSGNGPVLSERGIFRSPTTLNSRDTTPRLLTA